VTDGRGYVRDLRTLISRPTVLVFADYTCTNLCGPVVAFVASALVRSGLAADQYRMIVVGLDPKDGAADANRMRHDYLGDDAALNEATRFAIADQATVRRLTAALGYRYAYDKDHDQFIHPAAAFVLGSDGRVVRVLTGLGLSGSDMRLALVEASAGGRIGSFSDHVRLICSGFDPTQGAYNLIVSRLLAVTGIATVLTLGGLVGVLMLVSRRRTA
jgi:protein SCO1/2